MSGKFKIEIALTAIVLLVASFGIATTARNRIKKGTGEITTENYTEFMDVGCALGSGFGDGFSTMWYDYYITVEAKPYYKLENVTVSYSFKSGGADFSDDTITVNVEAGKSYSKEYNGAFSVTRRDNFGGMWSTPTLSITVKSVTGTYKYTV